MEIMLQKGDLYEVQDSDANDWIKAYPTVNVWGELEKMRVWCEANPSKRKTKRGVKSFIVRWLARCAERGEPSPVSNSKKSIREMDQRDMLCDISWLREDEKPSARAYFMEKYGYVYEG